MTKQRKWIFYPGLAAVLMVICVAVWGIASIPGILHDCYGQWVTAELVTGFQEQHGRLPTSWQELEPIYGDGRGLHHGGLSFTQVQDRMDIQFSRLPELEKLALTTTNALNIPNIISTKSGRRSHWAGAEPNRMIYQHFVDRRLSNPEDASRGTQPPNFETNTTSPGAVTHR